MAINKIINERKRPVYFLMEHSQFYDFLSMRNIMVSKVNATTTLQDKEEQFLQR